MDAFTKQPAESVYYTADFADTLLPGDEISAPLAFSFTPHHAPGPASPLVLDDVTFTATSVTARISAGQDGIRYKITARVQTVAGEILEHDFLLRIKEV